MSPTPWTYTPNGDTPEVDGYIVADAEGNYVAVVNKEDDARAICNHLFHE